MGALAAKRKSSSGVGARKAGRTARVARSLVAGSTVTAIAKKEGVSRATASKAANSPEVQLLITSLVEAERVKIRKLFELGLQAVEESFHAMRTAVFEGQAIDCGADHYARLTGVKCLTQLLTAGRQAVRPEPAARQTLTLEELKQLASTDRPN
jgi:hypothetical protein